MIAVIDYGMGNLRSVQKAFQKLGFECEIVNNPQRLKLATHIVLPGVGAISQAMQLLNDSGMIAELTNQVNSGKPLLGICLGMQMLFDKSYEGGEYKGLGFVKGVVRRFDCDLKIPHVGWNKVVVKKQTQLCKDLPDNYFYFTHSYHADKCDEGDIETTCNYGYELVVGVNKANVWGVQFHPEKSGDTGLQMLKNFGELK